MNEHTSETQLAAKLLAVIDELIGEFPGTAAAELVDVLLDRERLLIDQLAARLIRERLNAIIKARRQKRKATPPNSLIMSHGRPNLGHPQQSRLNFEEFEKWIPEQFEIEARRDGKAGKRVRRRDATREDFIKRRMLIQGEYSTELPALNLVIDLMAPYDKAEPGISFHEFNLKRSTVRRRKEQA